MTPSNDRFLTSREVGDLFNVDPKTAVRWAKAGKLPAIRTPGGHHRFRESDVRWFLDNDQVVR